MAMVSESTDMSFGFPSRSMYYISFALLNPLFLIIPDIIFSDLLDTWLRQLGSLLV